MTPSFNSTYIALVPKKYNPLAVTNFRPISLCNVIYKLISKVITNRLKPIMNLIILSSQSAFIQEKIITDNNLIAHWLLHSMKNNDGVFLKLQVSIISSNKVFVKNIYHTHKEEIFSI